MPPTTLAALSFLLAKTGHWCVLLLNVSYLKSAPREVTIYPHTSTHTHAHALTHSVNPMRLLPLPQLRRCSLFSQVMAKHCVAAQAKKVKGGKGKRGKKGAAAAEQIRCGGAGAGETPQMQVSVHSVFVHLPLLFVLLLFWVSLSLALRVC